MNIEDKIKIVIKIDEVQCVFGNAILTGMDSGSCQFVGDGVLEVGLFCEHRDDIVVNNIETSREVREKPETPLLDFLEGRPIKTYKEFEPGDIITFTGSFKQK